jgi:hypothetical protein
MKCIYTFETALVLSGDTIIRLLFTWSLSDDDVTDDMK